MSKKSKKDIEAEERYRASIDNIRKVIREASNNRSKISEFHGLENEFIHYQEELLVQYSKSKPIKHPRDKGDVREELLREFLLANNILPSKYKIPQTKIRAVSEAGNISPELDLVMLDSANSIALKKFGDTLEYVPIETVHGMIQVKSKLTKKALTDGLDNIAKFKRLECTKDAKVDLGPTQISFKASTRFGILFAFEYDYDWVKSIRLIEEYCSKIPSREWPNLIVILDKGHLVFGNDQLGSTRQHFLERLTVPKVHGILDTSGTSLLSFYGILTDLLRTTKTIEPNIENYIRLPLTTGRFNYRFEMGAFFENATCTEHGVFLRKLQEKSAEKLLLETENQDEITLGELLSEAYGQSDTIGFPASVKLYNPENIPLSECLLYDDPSQGMSFDQLVINGSHIVVPRYYSIKEEMFSDCPDCVKRTKRKKTKNSKNPE